MTSLKTILIFYILGGLTFVPAVFLIILACAAITLPRRDVHAEKSERELATSSRHVDENQDLGDFNRGLPEDLRSRSHEHDVSAGYFAVCREYVPGGVNGKPPERTTPAGEIVAAESPSVYQSMYRSIFDRNKLQGPTAIESSKTPKRARNVFYVVLRHSHLVLFDDSEQLEVRYVIALVHYNVDIYAGGEDIPEGELWVKRNCIRLVKKEETMKESSLSAPYYLFSDNCSEKEDFYHTLLRNQAREAITGKAIPTPLHFESDDMIKLVRQLHGSEETFQSRWMNAMIGRIFLALYKTSDIEDFVRWKVTKKISRVSKPAFITSLQLQDIDMGNSAPVITNPKLRELTLEGDLTIEADVKYNGQFKLQIAAVARIDLGSRFKAREVDLVLAGIFKKLEGHMLFRIKPPPSNRIWFTFESMPKIDISIEPIVSTRQITYGFILRAIESRIREVIAETLVMPNWDDSPFTNTRSECYRGGIWDHNRITRSPVTASGNLAQPAHDFMNALPSEAEIESLMTLDSDGANTAKTDVDKPPKAGLATDEEQENFGTGLEIDEPNIIPGPSAREDKVEKPKALRSTSFAPAATPIISRGSTSVDTARLKLKRRERDATNAMKILSSKSSEASPLSSPTASPSAIEPKQIPKDVARGLNLYSGSSIKRKEVMEQHSVDEKLSNHERSLTDEAIPMSFSTVSSNDSASIYSKTSSSAADDASLRSNTLNTHDRRKQINDSFSIATAAAKKWGLGVLARQTETRGSANAVENEERLNKPIGRGQPLPPPGVPLPRPSSSGWSVPVLNPLKKRLDPPTPPLPSRPTRKPAITVSSPRRSMTTPIVMPERMDDGRDENLLVVSAPIDSTPASPSTEESREEKELSAVNILNTPLYEEPSQKGDDDSISRESQAASIATRTPIQAEDESFDAWDVQEAV